MISQSQELSRPGNKHYYLLLLIVLIVSLFIQQVQGAAFIQISTNPSIVQSRDAQLIIGFQVSNAIENGGWMTVDFPKVMTLSSSLSNCKEESNQIQSIKCQADTTENRLTIKFGSNIKNGQNYQILIDKAVNVPITNATVDPIRLTTSQNEFRDAIFTATPGTLPNVQLQPISDQAGVTTVLQVSIKTANAIPKKGKLHILVSEKWNQGSTDRSIEYFTAIQCNSFILDGNKIAEGQYVCAWFDNNRIEIEGQFKNDGISAGKIITINIVGFRNPIRVIDSFNIFRVYSSGENRLHVVDMLLTSVRITTPARFMQPDFSVSIQQKQNEGIVQEFNIMDVKFQSPIPFGKDCSVEYWFPTQFYNADLIDKMITGDLWAQSKQTYTKGTGSTPAQGKFIVTTEDSGKWKAVKFTACPDIRSQIFYETTRIYGLQQPVSTQITQSLKIYVKDAEGHTHALLESGFTFKPSAGPIFFSQASMNPTIVLSMTDIMFDISPAHKLYKDFKPVITIEFPSDYKVQQTCQITAISGLQIEAPIKCVSDKIKNKITMSDILQQDYLGGFNYNMQFKVKFVQVPYTLGGGQDYIKVTTYSTQGNSNIIWAVDSIWERAKNFLTITPGSITGKVLPASPNAYVQTDYTFQIKPQHKIPQYSIITIIYPDEVFIQDQSLSQTLCKDWKNFPSNMAVCNIFANNRTIIISKGFQKGEGGNGDSTIFEFKIPYITNPQTLDVTKSFIVTTRDQYFNLIDYTEKDLTIQMTKAALFKQSEFKLSSYQNTMRVMYQFTIVSTVPIDQGNVILITFPVQNQLPRSDSDYRCRSNTRSYIKQLTCSTKQTIKNAVLIVPNFYKKIPALETFDIQVNSIMNPNITKSSDIIRIQIFRDYKLDMVLNEDTKTMKIVTSIAYDLPRSYSSLTQTQKGAGLPSDYTITMKLEHSIAKDGGILIRYPPEVLADTSKGIKVTVDASEYGYFTKLENGEIDYSARQVLFLNNKDKKYQGFDTALVVDPNKDQKLTINFYNMRNPMMNQASASFELVTFNRESNVLYFIDQVVKDLVISAPCSYPCKTCSSAGKSQCTSCFQNSPMKFLEDQTCLKRCSEGRYFDVDRQACLRCDQSCLTCKDKADKCVTCGGSRNIMLRETQCVNDCGNGWIGSPSTNMCLKCKVGCTSCSQAITNCTACNPNGQTPFFYKWDCYTRCPYDVSVNINDQCIPCHHDCKTCSVSPNSCSTCESYMRFDRVNKKCLPACKKDEQIFNTKTGECDQCNKDCTKCVSNVNQCTQCKSGLTLNFDDTCKKDCGGRGATSQFSLNGICKQCQKPCKTCDGKASRCTTCIDNLLLYKSQCVDHCPSKYEPNNRTINQCILVGLICPAGFYVNAAGEGCVPNDFQCAKGFEINAAKTACIPAPGTPVPFPFFFMTICIYLVVTGSNLKDKHSTKFATCLIMLIGSMELLQYALIAMYAAMLEKVFVSLLAQLSFVMLIISNIIFTCFFRKQTKEDHAYQDYMKNFPKTKIIVPLFSLIVNFKCIRFIFSGFFGMDNAQTQFTSPRLAIHRNLKMMTLFHYVFVYGPIFFADFLIIVSTKWGHQLLILAFETAALQLLVIYLTFREMKDPSTLYLEGTGQKYSTLKPKKQSSVAVMGFYEDDQLNEEGLIREEKGMRKYHTELRTKLMTLILKQVGDNFMTCKERVDIGGSVSNVFTKFDKKSMKLKRAFSMEDLHPKMANKRQLNTGGSEGTRIDEYYSDDSASESSGFIDSDDSKYQVLFHRRNSFPFDNKETTKLEEDAAFALDLTKIKDAILEQKYADNCYHDVKKKEKIPVGKHIRKKKLVNRRTQTYLRELLWVEGEDAIDSDNEIIMEEEIEVEKNYAAGLINGVIDGISDTGEVDEQLSKRALAKKMAKERKQKAMASDPPEFELQEIMGEFDIDDEGNYIILRDEKQQLVDKYDRVVNERGYLVDKFGNVVNKAGNVVFKFKDLDADGEIPATYVFDKTKKNLDKGIEGNKDYQVDEHMIKAAKEAQKNADDIMFPKKKTPQTNIFASMKQSQPQNNQNANTTDEEVLVEQEFKQFKQNARMSDGFSSDEGADKPLAGDHKLYIDENQNIDDMIDIITKKTVPQRRSRFKKDDKKRAKSNKKGSKKGSNPPPKRFNAEEKLLFRPGELKAIGDKKAKEIKKIAGVISGMADQVVNSMPNNEGNIHDVMGLESSQPENILLKGTSSGISSFRRGAAQGDFFRPKPSGEVNTSVVSQEFGLKKERGISEKDSKLRKVYGNLNSISVLEKAAHKVSQYSPGRGRPDSSSNVRISSDDPRLQTLGLIYNNQFQKTGSTKKMIQGGFRTKRPTGVSQIVKEDTRVDMVNQTINRLNQQYSQQMNNIPTFNSNFQDDQSAQFVDDGRQQYFSKQNQDLTPLQKQNWLKDPNKK